MSHPKFDIDAWWKTALESLFPSFMRIVAPDLHRWIDWRSGVKALDKELLPLQPRGTSGRRFVDKLVEVRLKNGARRWILIHVELQDKKDDLFPERMFVYRVRLRDRYRRPILSIAVLTDLDSQWRPTHFEEEFLGTRLRFEFHTVKLIDFLPRLAELESSENPFALLIAAFLRARTSSNPEHRLEWKVRFVRQVIRSKGGRDLTAFLFRMVDNLIELEGDMKKRFDETISRDIEAGPIELLSNMEWEAIRRGMTRGQALGIRIGREEGLEEGLEQGLRRGVKKGVKQGVKQGKSQGRVEGGQQILLRVLRARFHSLPLLVRTSIKKIKDPRDLDRLAEVSARAGTLAEFVKQIPRRVRPKSPVPRHSSLRTSKSNRVS